MTDPIHYPAILTQAGTGYMIGHALNWAISRYREWRMPKRIGWADLAKSNFEIDLTALAQDDEAKAALLAFWQFGDEEP